MADQSVTLRRCEMVVCLAGALDQLLGRRPYGLEAGQGDCHYLTPQGHGQQLRLYSVDIVVVVLLMWMIRDNHCYLLAHSCGAQLKSLAWW